MTQKSKIFLGTPTANGLMMSDFVHAAMRMVAHLAQAGVETVFHTVDGPDLAMQRDMLAQTFLASDCTHLLLVGGHVSFPPDLASRLLAAGKPLVGALHPRGAIDLARLSRLAAERDFDAAVALSFDWGVRLLDNTVTVRNGLCRVASFSSEVVLIERSCLERIIAAGVAPPYSTGTMALHAFFRDLPDEGAPRLDRDEGLCRRWSAAGGEVWAHVASEVRAIAELRFGLPFVAYVKALHEQRLPDVRLPVAADPFPPGGLPPRAR